MIDENKLLQQLPATIREVVEGYTWERDTVGESGADVCRLSGPSGSPDLFLKHGEGAAAGDIIDEMVRLRWLQRQLPVPSIVRVVSTSDTAWLLTTAIAGRTAYQSLEEQPETAPSLVASIAVFLRRLHAIPVTDCPFSSDHRYRLSQARSRIDAGVVDIDDFDDERAGWSAERVWTAMQSLLPIEPDPVVTHGDFSLDNLIVQNGKIVGCIDVGRAGVADRYQDLAIIFNSLGQFGPALQAELLRQYGVEEPDDRKLKFHLLLDECF